MKVINEKSEKHRQLALKNAAAAKASMASK
jgi:hypothetical protein